MGIVKGSVSITPLDLSECRARADRTAMVRERTRWGQRVSGAKDYEYRTYGVELQPCVKQSMGGFGGDSVSTRTEQVRSTSGKEQR